MTIRYAALDTVPALLDDETTIPVAPLSEVFGSHVFGLATMEEYLPESTYLEMEATLRHGQPLSDEATQAVAEALLRWSLEHGATHFTHWFQPLTGAAAQKHESFFKPPFVKGQRGVESLSAAELTQREPDASSFPHGGLRGTEAARGYTVWDPTSPAFLQETLNGRTLFIPAVFVSYTGESLDYKAPLLRSIARLNDTATAVARYFDPAVRRVVATLGWEQEYFVVDARLYNARPDLVMTGRTLVGTPSPRGQQLEDNYFAVIPERVQVFMVDFERAALRMGIPLTTRHNEVAPAQYECAPMFEELNVAIDHNVLLMEVMQQVAARHGLRVLLHEKPYAGVNGSGKHNNWSLATDGGKNLLSPGTDPGTNLYFLTFFLNVLQAVNRHEEVLRAGIASAGNEHRLGANEAPPAIISAFTGSHLAAVLAHVAAHGPGAVPAPAAAINLGIPGIPALTLDNTDRNRTSPFPFTGNKFEFRAVGAGANCAAAMTNLNVIVADQLAAFHTAVEARRAAGETVEAALAAEVQALALATTRIVFNGDNYAAAWAEEAGRRGLSHHATTPQALNVYEQPEVVALFERHGVLTAAELHARLHIQREAYVRTLDIEVQTLDQLLDSHIYPAVTAYLVQEREQVRGMRELNLPDLADHLLARVGRVATLLRETQVLETQLEHACHAAHAAAHVAETARQFAEVVKPLMHDIRRRVDQLELLVDDCLWTLPKYRELLFLR